MTKEHNLGLFKKILCYGTVLNAIFIGIFYLVFPLICPFFFENFAKESNMVLNIFLIANIFLLPSVFLGYPFLAAWGHPNFCNYSLLFTSLFHVVGLLILFVVGAISIYSVAAMVLFCEILTLVIRIYGVKKYRLWNVKK